MDKTQKTTRAHPSSVPTLMGTGVEEKGVYNNRETLKYKIIEKDGPIEIRDYLPMITAEVTVPGDRRKAANKGFMILASYIFGKNAPREKLAMTSPVVEAQAGQKIAMTSPVVETANEGEWIIKFVMPAEYSLDRLPKPIDQPITFRAVEAKRQAVIRFSGIATHRVIANQTNLLLDFLKTKNLKAATAPCLYFYNPPYTLPWNRRNEVACEIEI